MSFSKFLDRSDKSFKVIKKLPIHTYYDDAEWDATMVDVGNRSLGFQRSAGQDELMADAVLKYKKPASVPSRGCLKNRFLIGFANFKQLQVHACASSMQAILNSHSQK